MTVSVAPPARFPLDRPLAWLLLLALGHVVARVAVSPGLKWDEAEQVLWSQQLALGYGAQPPLYTWLQWGVNQLLGPSVLALSLLKHTLLALTYVFMYLAGRELLAPRGAWWAAASMLLMPALGWYSIREHTHTVLITTLTCGLWWLLLRGVRRPRALGFVLIGLVCGLGVLAKYSFALIAVALLAAALTVPQVRRALLVPGWWWAPVVGLLVVAPHAVWLIGHLDEATGATVAKMAIDPAQRLATGLPRLLGALAGSLALFALLALWAFRTACWRPSQAPASAWAQALFVRYLMAIGLALLALVWLAGVTAFKSRWLLPMVCVVPLAVFAARPDLQQHPRARRYTLAIVALALVILTAAAVRPWYDGLRGDPGELNHPVADLAAALRRAGYDGRGVIVASHPILAAELRTRFPQARATACYWRNTVVGDCMAAARARAEAAGQPLLLIDRQDASELNWWDWVEAPATGLDMQRLELPFLKVRAGAPPARYEYVWLAPATTLEPPT